MSNTQPTRRLTPASCETLLTLLETLPHALFLIDDATTIVYANASAQALIGATQEDFVGKSLWRGAPQVVSTALYQAVQQTRQTRAPSEVEYVSPVTRSWLHVQLSPTVGGLMVQIHQGRAAAPRQETFPQGGNLCMNDLEGLYSGVIVLTPEGIVLEINEVPLAQAQIRREEVIGQPLAEARWWSFYPTSQEQLRAAVARASRGETVRFEAVVHPRESRDHHLQVAITPRMDADHHVEYLVLAGLNISARKRAEAEIHALIDAIPQLVWTARPDGYIDSLNQRWREYTGLSTEQAQGDGWMQSLHPEDWQRVRAVWQRAIQTGELYETEERLRQHTTGKYRWFLARAMPVRDEAGQILKWFGTNTDIEEQKRAEQQLKESEENWQILAETVPQLVWIERADGAVEYANHQYLDYLQARPEQLQSSGWSHFVHADDALRTLAAWRHACASGEPYAIEYRLKQGQTGAYRWFLVRAVPMRDEAGQILKWFGTCTDIEEQKRAEQQLKESEENWRVLAETVPQLVWTTRPDGRVDYCNQRYCEYTQTDFEQLRDYGWRQFLHPEDTERVRALRQHSLETGEPFESEHRFKDGKTGIYRWFLARALPMRDETGQILKWFGTATDIDDQKRMEEVLRQSQKRIRALIDSNIIGIVSVEEEGHVIVEANDAWLHMTGYSREDVQSRTLTRANTTLPEQAPLIEHAIQELTARGQHTPIEAELVCQDGSRLPVLMGAVIFQEHP
ncbi:MAG TPA: PAS domain S-box protein, partial [Ktedonobacteraceae bacterium]|nr:PAS domain S-box protein [Ktedonobacteraceae bacterium]